MGREFGYPVKWKELATLISSPQVWEIDPFTHQAQLIAQFPDVTSAFGISEVHPDVFAVAVGWVSEWTLHTAWQPNSVLVADSEKGVMYEVDVAKKAHKLWLDDTTLKPNATAVARLGINGIHPHDGYLYFTKSFLRPTIERVRMNSKGKPAGPVEPIIDRSPWPTNLGDHGDDFTFDKSGNMWMTADPSNLLVKVNVAKRTSKVVAGGLDDPVLAGDTSAAFGRTSRDKDILYINANGGIAFPGKTGVEGGKIAAIDTSCLE